MTTEQSHETSADHSCGCGHDHGESHESPKPQEVACRVTTTSNTIRKIDYYHCKSC